MWNNDHNVLLKNLKMPNIYEVIKSMCIVTLNNIINISSKIGIHQIFLRSQPLKIYRQIYSF